MKSKALALRLSPKGSKLASDLAAAEKIHDELSKINPAAAERLSAVAALYSIIEYFAGSDVEFKPLLRLRDALVSGGPTMMLMPPKKGRGRRTDRPYLQQVKGVLAGIVQVLENSGKSRADAAAWVARNIPKALETKSDPRLAIKPSKSRLLQFLSGKAAIAALVARGASGARAF